MPLRPKYAEVAVLHQQGSVVDGEDALVPEAEECRPTVVAVAAQVPLAVGVPVRDDSRRTVSYAVLGKQLLQDLVHRGGQTRLVLPVLMALPPYVASLVVLYVVRARGEVARAGICGLPLRVLQDLVVDRHVACVLAPNLDVPPPGRSVLDGVLRHAGAARCPDSFRISAHVLRKIGVDAPRPRNLLLIFLPPPLHKLLGAAERLGDLRLGHALLVKVDGPQAVLVFLVPLRRALREQSLRREVRLVKLRGLLPAMELAPLVRPQHLPAIFSATTRPLAPGWCGSSGS
mmetsp:Transcript_30596/g.90822  ORF Transcript_30596/g.90822 Transcript_30596/m.90822 type:complete len:288 (-) Transcript_30596:182-1045(-)